MSGKLQANGVCLVHSFEHRQKNDREKYKPDHSLPLPVINRAINLLQAAGWLNTIVFELLNNPKQLRQVKQHDDGESATKETIRWVPMIVE